MAHLTMSVEYGLVYPLALTDSDQPRCARGFARLQGMSPTAFGAVTRTWFDQWIAERRSARSAQTKDRM